MLTADAQKMHLVATSASKPDWQVDFILDASLTVSSLRFPKDEISRNTWEGF